MTCIDHQTLSTTAVKESNSSHYVYRVFSAVIIPGSKQVVWCGYEGSGGYTNRSYNITVMFTHSYCSLVSLATGFTLWVRLRSLRCFVGYSVSLLTEGDREGCLGKTEWGCKLAGTARNFSLNKMMPLDPSCLRRACVDRHLYSKGWCKVPETRVKLGRCMVGE